MRLCPVGQYQDGGELIDPSRIAIEKVKTWISVCDQHECRPSLNELTRMPELLVIDVIEECITTFSPSKPNCGYFALSYVWGSGKAFLLTQKNYSVLRSKGSLRQFWDRIPLTIRDAMVLTKRLDFRYLWVDQLCIIQDDAENKMKHIQQMDSIYANALVTVVAAEGEDSDQGLKGVIGGSNSHRSPQILDFSLGKIIISSTALDDKRKPVYFSRGWTFQEYHMSKRLLVFIDNQVIWRCREFEWRETRRIPISFGFVEPSFLPIPRVTTQMTWPDMWTYIRSVEEYNTRKLGYDADALSAFTGVLKAINPAFPSGFLQGLPELYFDLALLWQPARPLRRRMTSKDEYSPPSWSWVGWAGELDLDLCAQALAGPYSSSYHMATFPLTNWYKSAGPYGRRIPVSNDYHRYFQLRVPNFDDHNFNSAEPDFFARLSSVESGIAGLCLTGWTISARKLDKSKAFEPRNLQPWPCYRHRSMPDGFGWPVPIVNNEAPLQSPDLSFLHFQSCRAYFEIGNYLYCQEKETYINCCSAKIIDNNGAIAGILRLNSTELPNHKSERDRCELVSISTGMANLCGSHCSFTLDEASDMDCLRRIIQLRCGPTHFVDDLQWSESRGESLRNSIGVYSWYNVLWIEWKDGVAYRKALGRVFKEVWEAQPLEYVDVTLG